MILFINTTDFDQIHYALIEAKVFEKKYKIDSHQSYQILVSLQKFLKKSKIQPLPNPLLSRREKQPITKIVACKGPGSFTGTRIGVTHALALGFAWNVPVKFIAKDKIPKDLSKLR